MAYGQACCQSLLQQGIIPFFRIHPLVLQGDRNGPFGQAFEHQVIKVAFFSQFDGGFYPVA